MQPENEEPKANEPDQQADATSPAEDSSTPPESPQSEESPQVDEAPAEPTPEVVVSKSPHGKFHPATIWAAAKNNKKMSVPVGIVVLLALLLLVPVTRYALLGTFMKSDYSLKVLDEKTGKPVTDAKVEIAGTTTMTNKDGMATVHTKVGNHTAMISKTYYETANEKVVVPVLKQKTIPTFQLHATGRQVSLHVVNFVSGDVVENVTVSALGSTAKTDASGNAIIVLPAGKVNTEATLSGPGYNNTTVELKILNVGQDDNKFMITPAGKVYFLSKLSGKISVVKANLDGTARKTVVAGTGYEDDGDTLLLASRDWKYLAFKAVRQPGNEPKMYLIKTANDQMTEIDSGADVEFYPVGWHDDDFLYTVYRQKVKSWQPNQQALKTYNATLDKLTTVDQTLAAGSNEDNYQHQDLGTPIILDDGVVYTKTWQGYNIDNKKGQLVQVDATGAGKKVVKEFSFTNNDGYDYGYQSMELAQYKPNAAYLSVSDATNKFYLYQGGKVQTASITSSAFYKGFPTYLVSPNDKQTFWSESRDGKNTLFVGDDNANNEKQIASLSDYKPYGWFTTNYLLVSKDGSELYIMPVAGGKAQKITDYHKPNYDFNGYGYGYGAY